MSGTVEPGISVLHYGNKEKLGGIQVGIVKFNTIYYKK